MVVTRRSLAGEAGEKGVKVHVSDILHGLHKHTYNKVWDLLRKKSEAPAAADADAERRPSSKWTDWSHGPGDALNTFLYKHPTTIIDGKALTLKGQGELLRYFTQNCPSLVRLRDKVLFEQLVKMREALLGPAPEPDEPNPALEHQELLQPPIEAPADVINRAFSEVWPQLKSKFNWTESMPGGDSDDDDVYYKPGVDDDDDNVYYKPGVEKAFAVEGEHKFTGKRALLHGFACLEPSILDLPHDCVIALADERSELQQQQQLLQQQQLQGQQLQSQTPPITTDSVRRLTETPQPTTADTEPGGQEHKSWLGSASPCVSSSSSSSGGTSVAGTGRGDDEDAAGQVAIGSPRSVGTSLAPASPMTEAPVTSAPAVSALETPAASLVTEAPVSTVEAARNATAKARSKDDAKGRDLQDAEEVDKVAEEAERVATQNRKVTAQKRQRLAEEKEETAKKLKLCQIEEQMVEERAVFQAKYEALEREKAELMFGRE
jgi:hypothetical protein